MRQYVDAAIALGVALTAAGLLWVAFALMVAPLVTR